MGREVRRVPKDWLHPKRSEKNYEPLLEGYYAALKGFEEAIDRDGMTSALDDYGGRPISEEYMPEWPEEEKTHIQMYEDTSEGTPISPVMETPEELAHWLADNNASAFAHETATYEQWLSMIRRGWAPSMVMADGELKSGVAAAGGEEAK